MTKRREFLRNAGVATVGAVAASTLSAPAVLGQSTIRWRLQTYAGPALAAHVIKPAIDAFNKAANGEMVIEPCLSGYHPHPLYVVCTHFPE